MQGQTLSSSTGTWTGTANAYSYAWQACDTSGSNCATITGATASTYTLTATDVGKTIRTVVTATNAGGSATATSAQSTVVAAAPSGSAPTCTTTLTPSTFTAAAVTSAAGGSVLCLSAGTYHALSISGANPGSYVTIQPAANATVTVDGAFTLNNSSFLRFQGLTVTGSGPGTGTGFNITGNPSHDFQFINDDIGDGTYGIVIDGANGTSNVLIQGDRIHDLDFTGTSAGYAGGQGVTCYYCASNITVSHSTFYANSWHYIQCGGCDNMTVDHNLFRCPCNEHAGAHLNVFQIWQGGSNDSFTNNIVQGNPNQVGTSGEVCGGCVLFENGAGGAVASDTFSNYNISNNLFVNAGGSLPIQVQITNGGTVSHNTVAEGFQYGNAIGFNGTLGSASTNLTSEYNVIAGQTGNGQAYEYGCNSGCVTDHNVADSHGGTSGTGSINGWTQSWQTTTWDPTSGNPPPAGYYQPTGLASGYGYQGVIGPWG